MLYLYLLGGAGRFRKKGTVTLMNAFFVFSPLQLINAVEAKESLSLSGNTLIIVRENSLFWPMSVYRPLVDTAAWDAVHYVFVHDHETVKKFGKVRWFYLRWLLRQRIDRLIASLGRSEALFMGRYYEPIHRHIGNTLPHETLYLLDDGTDTLFVNKLRQGLVAAPALSLKEKVSLFLLGLRNQQADSVTFFSAYDMPVRTDDRFILNRYPNFRSRIAHAAPTEEIWFLGQPLTLDGFMAKNTYLDYLASAKAFYAGRRFVYLPHGREQKEDVDEIKRALDCDVRRYGLPIEVVLGAATERPKEVTSFFTSAIQNCSLMFGDTLQLTSVYLEPRDLLRFHAFVEGVYEHFRSGIGVNLRLLTVAELKPQRTPPC